MYMSGITPHRYHATQVSHHTGITGYRRMVVFMVFFVMMGVCQDVPTVVRHITAIGRYYCHFCRVECMYKVHLFPTANEYTPLQSMLVCVQSVSMSNCHVLVQQHFPLYFTAV